VEVDQGQKEVDRLLRASKWSRENWVHNLERRGIRKARQGRKKKDSGFTLYCQSKKSQRSWADLALARGRNISSNLGFPGTVDDMVKSRREQKGRPA